MCMIIHLVTVEMYREWRKNQNDAEAQCRRLREKAQEMQKSMCINK